MFILVCTLEDSLTFSHQIVVLISRLDLIIPPQVEPSCVLSSFCEPQVNRLTVVHNAGYFFIGSLSACVLKNYRIILPHVFLKTELGIQGSNLLNTALHGTTLFFQIDIFRSLKLPLIQG